MQSLSNNAEVSTEALKLKQVTSVKNEKSLTDHPAYLAEGVSRIAVPQSKVSWEVEWPEYELLPQEAYTHSVVKKEFANKGIDGWAADPEAKMTVDRVKSYEASLPVNAEGEVLNPGGRTGIKNGRGLLGQPGPNFAADPVIFRLDPVLKQLQVLLIQRKDTGEWAIPGGMVDFGELLSQTLKRELGEETGVSTSMEDSFVVYKGYVDDPRNTDKAWMETTVATKLLDPDSAGASGAQAGDDAASARWVKVEKGLFEHLYASHGEFVRRSLNEIITQEGERLVEVSSQLQNLVG